MDPLEPTAPRPVLPAVARAAAIRRVRRDSDQPPDEQPAPGGRAEDEPAPGEDDDGRPHVDVTA